MAEAKLAQSFAINWRGIEMAYAAVPCGDQYRLGCNVVDGIVSRLSADTSPTGGADYVSTVEGAVSASGAKIATVVGRYLRWTATSAMTGTSWPGMRLCWGDKTFDCPVAFQPQTLDDILGKVVSDAGKAQLRIAETEKYPHVTYFFNGGVEVGLGIPKAMTGRSLLERRARV